MLEQQDRGASSCAPPGATAEWRARPGSAAGGPDGGGRSCAGARVGVPARRGPAPLSGAWLRLLRLFLRLRGAAHAGRGGLEHSAGAVAGWRAGGQPRPRRAPSLRWD
ncbi:hypothetical protein ACPA9J_36350 [Pseudomonas aeruginosa]